MVIVWKVTDLAFLKKESGRHIFFSQSTSSSLYSEVMFSGSRNLLSFHVCAKNISAAYVYKYKIRKTKLIQKDQFNSTPIILSISDEIKLFFLLREWDFDYAHWESSCNWTVERSLTALITHIHWFWNCQTWVLDDKRDFVRCRLVLQSDFSQQCHNV